ncbi:hypothetical protein Cni_G21463 [Canna indica]|uniref:Uncharacterized protein n=1 Tax=Canna indica TaxID=4628 RepID=A0AAQ3QHA4_9LILI|nr:hypothetical protein Cni_G21463 [Canna indica]
MDGFGNKPKSWSENSAATPSGTSGKDQAAMKDFGSSMNALSFGFLATAILVSMFLIMAIFEHLLRSRASPTSSQSHAQGFMGVPQESHHMHSKKVKNSQNEATSNMVDLSVLMPGQQYPTYIALPAPLPCPREGVICPPDHDHHPYSSP